MGKAEILAAINQLTPEERAELFDQLCDLQNSDLLSGTGPTEEQKRLLDKGLAEFERDCETGRPWAEVLRELRASADD